MWKLNRRLKIWPGLCLGYNGTLCENVINICQTLSPCQNGLCKNSSPADYTCVCNTGYTGKNCEVLINSCLPNPCNNNGLCNQQAPGLYSCVCPPGWGGSTCNQSINYCLSGPCSNSGTCNSFFNSYNCTCAPGKAISLMIVFVLIWPWFYIKDTLATIAVNL